MIIQDHLYICLRKTSKQIYYFDDIQLWVYIYNTILQYLRDSGHNDDNNKNYKKYLHRGPCTPYGKMTQNENLKQRQNHF